MGENGRVKDIMVLCVLVEIYSNHFDLIYRGDPMAEGVTVTPFSV